MKLRTKMLTFLLIPVIFLIGALSLYSYFTAKSALETQMENANKSTLNVYSSKINQTLVRQEGVTNELASSLSIAMTESEIRARIQAAKQSNPEIKNIMVAFNDKRYMDTDNWVPKADYDARTRAWYLKGSAANDLVYSDIYVDANSGALMVNMGHAISTNGQKVGVIAIELDLTKLFNAVDKMTTGKTGYSFIVDANGALIKHPEFKPDDNLIKVKNGILAPFFEKVKADKETAMVISIDGKDMIYNATPIGTTGWAMCSVTPSAELYEGISNMRLVSLLIGILVILILGGIIIWLTLNITNSLNKMKSLSEELSSGDFSDKPKTIYGDDEIGQLAKALYDMRSNLRELIKHVSVSAEQLAAASEQFTASADQSAQASHQIAVSITEVANGSNKQLNSIDKTTESVNKMSSNISHLIDTTNRGTEKANTSAQKASSGNEIIQKAIHQMNSIEKTVGSSAKVVEELGARSNEIGQIVDTISAIAGQTNLLALNAAIEAARAGEQGRGFAVVAEEVRKLAEQSQTAAKHISDLISKIRVETTKAVESMHNGTSEVKLGAEVVNEAGKVFEEINTMISEVNQQFTAAYKAIEYINVSNKDIVTAVEEIDKVSKLTTAETETVSAATEEQSASMHELSTSSQSLAKLAQELQIAASKFKV
ncbi:MAG: methyl-accepting chemotaxis sensory transducer with Cache sensor [Firmicutes bacterium]|nr:methyl-accepting chemotaxis sensory transducer with Cache sensor [Bacillota bacterium]